MILQPSKIRKEEYGSTMISIHCNLKALTNLFGERERKRKRRCFHWKLGISKIVNEIASNIPENMVTTLLSAKQVV